MEPAEQNSKSAALPKHSNFSSLTILTNIPAHRARLLTNTDNTDNTGNTETNSYLLGSDSFASLVLAGDGPELEPLKALGWFVVPPRRDEVSYSP